jgi:hypothetical protein
MSSMSWKGSGEKQGYRQRRSTRPEFVSRDLDLWAYQRAYIAAFNGRFRAECLNAHWFLNLADAREKMEDRRKYYNENDRMARSAKSRR